MLKKPKKFGNCARTFIVNKSLTSLSLLYRSRLCSEEALIESEQRFRSFAEATSDSFWEMDETLRFTYSTRRPERQRKGPRAKRVPGSACISVRNWSKNRVARYMSRVPKVRDLPSGSPCLFMVSNPAVGKNKGPETNCFP